MDLLRTGAILIGNDEGVFSSALKAIAIFTTSPIMIISGAWFVAFPEGVGKWRE